MNASIFTARKSSGYKFELTLHTSPDLSEGVVTTSLHSSKADAKAAAKAAGATPYNY